MEAEPSLEVGGLVRRYGEREALAGVSLSLQAGKTLTLFGPNGAGKTTLLRVLATLLLPHAGDVRVFGFDLPRDAHKVRSRVGMLGHDALLYRELSGRENLRFYARLYALTEPEARIAGLLDTCGMAHRADEPVRELSRGMVQRLAICRAVLHSPEVLLLDEPHSGLDPEAEQLVEPLIGRSAGVSRVLVTHDIERGLAQADRVIGLCEGHVELDGDASSIDAGQVRSVYAGSLP